MQEMVAEKKAAIRSGQSETSDMDLMGQLVKGQNLGLDGKPGGNHDVLTDNEVMGNAFVFILAGTSNTGSESLILPFTGH